MKLKPVFTRTSRVGVSAVLLFTLQHPVWARSGDAGLLPIQKSQINKSLIEDLFKNGNGNNQSNTGRASVHPGRNENRNTQNNGSSNNSGNGDNVQIDENGNMTPVPDNQGNNAGNNNSGNNNNGKNNNNNNNNNNGGKANNRNTNNGYNKQVVRSNVDDNFRCNLFESVPYADILSAVNLLNQAVKSPSCTDAKVNVQNIVDNNKTITDAVSKLAGFKDNPETIKAENVTEIVTSVDAAIRAATTIADSFAQTDVLKKECRQAMGAGDIAVAVNDLINGLTPYALMAASLTGGTAAVPFIVGGSIVTNAVSSMAKIINENSPNVKDAQVRRAIVENTCQFIRLDQKYKFLIKSRQEQIRKITEDISASQRLFSATMSDLSEKTNGLLNRKAALAKAAVEVNAKTTALRSQLDLDKQFMTGTSDEIKICQLGVQLAILANDNSSYVSSMLSSLDDALVAYGNSNIAQAQALKASSRIAIQSLQAANTQQFNATMDFKSCANVTRSFVETIDQSATLAKQLVKIAQESVEKGLQGNKEYGQIKAHINTLNEKQTQATRVTESLDNLKAYATAISQSEIDSEMSRLRRGLFGSSFLGGTSPVLQWFKYVKGLHDAEVAQFRSGVQALRMRAYRIRNGNNDLSVGMGYPGYYQMNKDKIEQNQRDAINLAVFNLKEVPLGTKEHSDACREMGDVWNRWTVAVDHLAAMDSFCNMIEPYVFDTRSEDRELVQMCRGFSATSAATGAYGVRLSTVASAKDQLVKNNTRDWAVFVQKKIDAMSCGGLTQKME